MEDDLITTKEVGDYRIKVYYCRDSFHRKHRKTQGRGS